MKQDWEPGAPPTHLGVEVHGLAVGHLQLGGELPHPGHVVVLDQLLPGLLVVHLQAHRRRRTALKKGDTAVLSFQRNKKKRNSNPICGNRVLSGILSLTFSVLNVVDSMPTW